MCNCTRARSALRAYCRTRPIFRVTACCSSLVSSTPSVRIKMSMASTFDALTFGPLAARPAGDAAVLMFVFMGIGYGVWHGARAPCEILSGISRFRASGVFVRNPRFSHEVIPDTECPRAFSARCRAFLFRPGGGSPPNSGPRSNRRKRDADRAEPGDAARITFGACVRHLSVPTGGIRWGRAPVRREWPGRRGS